MYELRIKLTRLKDGANFEKAKLVIINGLTEGGIMPSFCWDEQPESVAIVKVDEHGAVIAK